MTPAPITYVSNSAKTKINTIQETKNAAPYYCLVSTLNSESNGWAYSNQRFDLGIPKELVKQAQNQGEDKKWIVYQFTDKYALARTNADTLDGGGLVRMARCRLPATPKVVKTVKRQLTKFKQASWAHDKTSQKQARSDISKPDPVVSGWEYGCTKIIKWYSCPAGETENPEDNPECTFLYSECYEYGLKYVEEEEPPGGGGGSSDNGDPCEPCTQEPGGPVMPCESQPGGNDGVPQGCAVDEEIKTVEPCDTGNPALDDLNAQTKMNLLWENSNALSTLTPMSDRLEQGMFITKDPNTGNISYQDLPSDWQKTPCGINPPSDYLNDIPNNFIGFMHTHPFYEGEDRRSICGSNVPASYTSGYSEEDYFFLKSIADYLSDYTIKGYVIDGDNITTYNTITGLSGPEATDERCGY